MTTTGFVELSGSNYATYSVEYLKLLLALGSEIDVLCKILCERLDTQAPRSNIVEYRNCIVAHTKLPSEEVLVRRYDLTIKPWDAWPVETSPTWWRGYNDVKHERDAHFQDANLKNCVAALAGLFTLVLYVHKAEATTSALEPMPILLGREREPGRLLLESGYDIPAFF